MTTRVKVCGITRREDALAAVDAGADALGFVFAPSPRRVTPEDASRLITAAVPSHVLTVGVFVDETPEQVASIAHAVGLSAVQLHGAETLAQIAEVRGLCDARVVKGLRVSGREELLRRIDTYHAHCDALLLDAYVKGVAGGTGRTFDWELARLAVAFGVRVVLAGGLTPENVGNAVRRIRPFAVDVSSGVESAPGRKDANQVRAFLRAVREADSAGRTQQPPSLETAGNVERG